MQIRIIRFTEVAVQGEQTVLKTVGVVKNDRVRILLPPRKGKDRGIRSNDCKS